MRGPAYYNEHDKKAAAWLRELIKHGAIAPGVVDERSIEDVSPDDLLEFVQCHFFAGIGVWSYSLRRAGWPDDRPVWTASCPCQPFSSAGKGGGFADERHLWPSLEWLIEQCRPAEIYGEQVASKAVEPWIDLVHSDLENLDYAFGCVPFSSAGVGAPHIRDRAYWMAHSERRGLEIRNKEWPRPSAALSSGQTDRLGDTSRTRLDLSKSISGISGKTADTIQRQAFERTGLRNAGWLAHSDLSESKSERPSGWQQSICEWNGGARKSDRAGPTNGAWRDADWLSCADGLWRPVEPGTFPLADDVTGRMVQLRGFGNAINSEAARIWIEATQEAIEDYYTEL